MEKLRRIAIHSVPRSGSTWLGSIFDSHPNVVYKLQPLFSYAFKDRLTPVSTKDEVDTFFSELASTEDDFLDQVEGKSRNIIPTFHKMEQRAIVYKEVRYHHILQNLLKVDDSVKVIGLIRNPLSTVHSWLNAPKEFRADKGWRVEDEWRFAPSKNLDKPEEFNGYEKWKEVAQLFKRLQKEYNGRFYLLHYSKLISNPEEIVGNLFDFCGLEIQSHTLHFLNKSTKISVEDAYGVYRKDQRDDKWKEGLPEEIVDFIRSDVRESGLSEFI